MNTAVMTNRIAETSPRAKTRMAGVFFALTILTGLFAQGFISERLVVSGDAAATATNILTHEPQFRRGFAVYLIEMACQITMTALLYDLLKPVSRSVSLLAAIFGLIGCGIKTLSRLFYFAPLFVVGGAHYLSVFNTEQLQALAFLFLKVNDQGAAIALVFFPEGLPRCPVHLPASNSRCVVNTWRFGLAGLPVTAARIPSFPLHCGPRPSRVSSEHSVAPRVRRERTTMEGAGQRSSGVHLEMKTGASQLRAAV